MDLHYKREVAVGGLVLAALLVLFGGLTWLSGKNLLGGAMFQFGVRYDNVAGLATGDPVMISGVRVGRVAGFELRGVDDVVVFLEVRESVAPRTDATADVRPFDMLGAMVVSYRPGGAETRLPEDAIIDGVRRGQLLESAGALADRAGAVLTGFEALVSAGTVEDVRATLAATRRAMDAIAAIGSGPTVRQATRTLEALASTAARLDSTLGSEGMGRTIGRLDTLTASFNTMLVNLGEATLALRQVLLKVNDERGTMGRLVNDTTLYSELVRLSVSMRLLLDDVRERPGRYFHVSVF